MPEHPPKGEAFALADAFFAECQVVARFIDENVRAPVDASTGTKAHGIVFQGQLLRAIAWLRSILKLNHPGDFQAITAGARALFEGAVDVTLLHFDPATHNPDMMNAWEDSAKLKHAETVARYLAETGRAGEEGEKAILTYATREKARIENLRVRWWPNYKSKHPDRWTGRDLGRDSKIADDFQAAGFEEFYRLRYPQICWTVHGSGVGGIANVSPEDFPFIGGRAYREGARFAKVIAEVVCLHFGCWNKDAFAVLAEAMKAASGIVYVAGSAQASAAPPPGSLKSP